MSAAKWEPLLDADSTIAAFAAGRRVEYTFCGCDYQAGPNDVHGWIRPFPDRSKPEGVREAFKRGGGGRYRARIEEPQP